jgi:hypothetical protein
MQTKVDYLLIKLAEEASEVAQRALKAVEFGLEEVQPDQELSNTERIGGEVIDMITILLMLSEEGVEIQEAAARDEAVLNTMIEAKKAKVEKYMQLSRDLGKLE